MAPPRERLTLSVKNIIILLTKFYHIIKGNIVVNCCKILISTKITKYITPFVRFHKNYYGFFLNNDNILLKIHSLRIHVFKEVIRIFEVKTELTVNPVEEMPYQVMLKIEISDQGFQDRMFAHSFNHNLRIDVKPKRTLFKTFNIDDLTVILKEDKERYPSYSYLEDYMLNGCVFGFPEEYYAEEFKEKVQDILFNYIKQIEDIYNKAKSSRYSR